MKFDLRHSSLLRAQGLKAARAAMTRPRQAALGMAVAVLAAGLFGMPGSADDSARKADHIRPSVLDTVRAVQEGYTFPATDLARDVSISSARREAAMIDAGFAKTVTLAQAPAAERVEAALAENPDLPQTIVQGKDRIERPALRSKTGETIVLAQSAVARTWPVNPAPATATLAESSDHVEIESAMVRLAREAHDRTGKPAMSAQAMSEYLSLYALHDRVEAIGDALARDPQQSVGGAWVANFAGGMDDALFQDGLALGQESFGAIAGLDSVAQGVFSEDDRLVFGGFASAFGTNVADNSIGIRGAGETRGGSIGVFAVLDDGPFRVSALVRGDFARSFDAGSANQLDFSEAVQVLKAEVAARYRFEVSDWTVEPSAGLFYAAGRREVAGLGPVQSQLEDADSLKIRLGVKASGVVYSKSGTSVEPSVTIMIAEELKGDGNVTFLSGAPTGPADPVSGKTVGSVSFGVDIKDESGWTGFVRADGQVSEDDKPSAGVSAGVKTQW